MEHDIQFRKSCLNGKRPWTHNFPTKRETVHPIHVVCIANIYSLNSVWSHIFLFDILLGRRPSEFTAILMFKFWREATAALVPGFLCQSGRRRPENVSILSSLLSRELSHEQPFLLLIYYLARPTKTAMLRRLAAGNVVYPCLFIKFCLCLLLLPRVMTSLQNEILANQHFQSTFSICRKALKLRCNSWALLTTLETI